MTRGDNDNWLDEALDKALASHDTQPDFDSWQANHPEAVEKIRVGNELPILQPASPAELQAGRRPVIRRITMNSLFVKLAAAAAIVIAAAVGITQLTHPNDAGTANTMEQPVALTGPTTHAFADGSVVELAEGAQIRTYGAAGRRGFEHIAGTVDVTVARGQGEFIVTTPYGDVKALGTQFRLDLLDGVAANTKDKVQLLSVQVTEGKVEVSTAKGSAVLTERQQLVVDAGNAPYDYGQDPTVPARLKERIASMAAALEAGDARAWLANYNLDYMYKLIKGQEEYDPQRFGGSAEDLARLRQGFGDVASPRDLVERFVASSGLNGSGKLYVRAVELSAPGDHATVTCVRRESENHLVITAPQWHHFDNDWWQVDD